jgi:hypothetical protein
MEANPENRYCFWGDSSNFACPVTIISFEKLVRYYRMTVEGVPIAGTSISRSCKHEGL